MPTSNLSILHEPIPYYILALFAITTFVTVLIFLISIKKTNPKNFIWIEVGFIVWIVLQGILMDKDFYLELSTKIPRFPVAILPPVLLIIWIFNSKIGKNFVDKLPLNYLTFIQTIRIPVEITLFWLFLEKQVPQLMTFEGRNFDIFAGITAPIIGFLYFQKNIINHKTLLIWNFVCLGLVINIVLNAVLSLPLPFQVQAFEQPNVGVLKFPIGWLPSVVVPIVIFCHLASIRQLLKSKGEL